MKLTMRGGVAALAITGAALIAAGCGGSSGSGASAAAKDSAALDFVPKDAIGYITVDTDFDGENWKQFNDLAKAFDADFKGVEQELSDAVASDDEGEDKDEDVSYKDDVDPWLGEAAGVALLSAGEGEGGEGDAPSDDVFAWFELEDRAKFEDFAKSQGMEQGEKVGDYETFMDPEDEDSHIAYNDELAIFADSHDRLEQVVEYDGDSITDAEGVSDAIDEAGDDALVTLVLSGEGTRKAVEESPQLESLRESKQLEDFQSMAMTVSAEDDGFRVSGFVGAEGDDAPENVSHPVFEQLPANTVFALGGTNFGGAVKTFTEEAGRENQQIQQGVGAVTAALGVSLDDLEESLDGEFVLGMAADDEGLGSLAGGVAGAAMGGGLEGVDPAGLARSASIILAFEETGEASETLDKIASSAGGLAGATEAPQEGTAGDFETKQLTVQGFPLTTASSDEVAALTIGADVFDAWGEDSLVDADSFSAAWEAAEAPDESAGLIWFDAGRVADLAGLEGSEEADLGGMVGWIESDGSNARFGAFLHVDEG